MIGTTAASVCNAVTSGGDTLTTFLSLAIQRVRAEQNLTPAKLIVVGRLSVGEAGFLTHLLDTGISEQTSLLSEVQANP
jgi:hypothetical protein